MANKYSHKRIRYVYNLEDINKIIEISKQFTEVRYSEYSQRRPMRRYTHINDKQRYIEVTSQYVEQNDDMEYNLIKDKVCHCTWIFDKSGSSTQTTSPANVLRLGNAVYKPYDIVKARPELWTIDYLTGKIKETTGAIIGYNPKYDMTEHYVYVYDLNSAYSSVLYDKIIDTYNFRENDYVGENEVGFVIINSRIITIKDKDIKCEFVFPLIDSPFKNFVKKYYDIKKNAPKGSLERQEAKDILNFLVGLWQHTNPFLRAYVVNECNERIQNLLDEDSCMWNTDAIYSVKERTDLPMSETEIGKFKVEYVGLFRQKETSYQKVDKKEVSIRGVVNQVFDNFPDWNLLTDRIPYNELKYKLNKKTCRIEENINYKGEGKNA